MGKVLLKHILRLLWKMVENVFCLGSGHVGRGGIPPLKKLFLLKGWKQVQLWRNSPQFPPFPSITIFIRMGGVSPQFSENIFTLVDCIKE